MQSLVSALLHSSRKAHPPSWVQFLLRGDGVLRFGGTPPRPAVPRAEAHGTVRKPRGRPAGAYDLPMVKRCPVGPGAGARGGRSLGCRVLQHAAQRAEATYSKPQEQTATVRERPHLLRAPTGNAGAASTRTGGERRPQRPGTRSGEYGRGVGRVRERGRETTGEGRETTGEGSRDYGRGDGEYGRGVEKLRERSVGPRADVNAGHRPPHDASASWEVRVRDPHGSPP